VGPTAAYAPYQWLTTQSGAGGGGITAANVPGAGGIALERWEILGYAVVAGGTAGATATDGKSSAVIPPACPLVPGVGGTGGGAATAGSGGNGGNGVRGGGGGGGGASTNGFNSGAGGKGGDGFVQVITYF
jgi:hypothetical protein